VIDLRLHRGKRLAVSIERAAVHHANPLIRTDSYLDSGKQKDLAQINGPSLRRLCKCEAGIRQEEPAAAAGIYTRRFDLVPILVAL